MHFVLSSFSKEMSIYLPIISLKENIYFQSQYNVELKSKEKESNYNTKIYSLEECLNYYFE